ncbi:MAG: RluA family pseudouridine synthase [Oscillatoriales cyanobacterium C42_A2020_001]|nr:RluA family pseudouridine synthase [Leptolyngbyaceae cyanobacterium C42_A2020_001]
MNQGWIYRNQVKKTDVGLTILEFYQRHYRHSTLHDWQERIASGKVLLNGRSATAETILQVGQELTYDRPPWQEPDVPLSFDVLHEDRDLLAVVKPVGLPVLPGGGFLEHTLLWQLKQQYPAETPVPIHRLGRGTSGLMLLARSPLARSGLSQQMRDRQIRKTYRALVGTGNVPESFTVTCAIGKIPHPVLGYVYGAASEGFEAHSECRVLKRMAETTLLEVTIRTGRPHQIRIHLAVAGFPLIGDPLYEAGGVPRQARSGEKLPVPGDIGYHLHAYHVAFLHPRTQQPIKFTAPVPARLS